MRAIVIALLFVSGVAHAQQWTPNSGWDGQKQLEDTQRRIDENRRQIEEHNKQFDEDFASSQRTTDFAFKTFFPIAAAFVLVGLFLTVAKRRRRIVMAYEPIYEGTSQEVQFAQLPTGDIDVTVLRIGVDGRAGKLVASEIERLTKQYETTSAQGRSQL